MADLDTMNFGANQGHPAALPPTRKIQLLHTNADGIAALCTNCQKKPGKLTCARCHAVKFCSAECQKALWPKHKVGCNSVKEWRAELLEAIEMVEDFEGKGKFLKSKMVVEGRLNWREPQKQINSIFKDPSFFVTKCAHSEYFPMIDYYLGARKGLVDAYVTIGTECHSPIAFRLASENVLDLLCMTYKKPRGEENYLLYAAWMLAAGMNQETLNYLGYFSKRLQVKERLPYLDMESQNFDIEDLGVFDLSKKEKVRKNMSKTRQERHLLRMMLVGFGILLRFRRLQQNLVERRKSIIKWKSFLMGTHPDVGKDSPIQWLKGERTILERIQNMVVRKDLVEKLKKDPAMITSTLKQIDNIDNVITIVLLSMGEMQYYICSDIPDDEEDQSVDTAASLCGLPWYMSPACKKILQNFMRFKRISEKPWHQPPEGFAQACLDTDPTKVYQDCTDIRLICWKSGTSAHTCM